MILLLGNVSGFANRNDSLKYYLSLNYTKDLSDTYGGGNLFSGEIVAFKTWYGLGISFGHFQSKYEYLFKIPYEEIGQLFEIPIQEMANLKLGTVSGFLRPIQSKRFATEIVFGIGYGQAQCFFLRSLDYSFNIDESQFNYIYRDYHVIKRNHFGYQVGISTSYYFFEKVGLQVNARLHDLSNGGTFFLIGGGVCFKL